ncbi:MAG: TonB family protein [Chitinispirillales bacterium]|nr:TonB family protein [Chitinispirillales bacterium]
MRKASTNVWLAVATVAAASLFWGGALAPAYAQKKKSKEEIEAQIRALEQKMQAEQANRAKAAEANRPTGQDLNQIIERYERLLEGCAVKKSDRCADVMYTLGSLYYDQGKDNYAKAVERFAEYMNAYERPGRSAQPTHPIPDMQWNVDGRPLFGGASPAHPIPDYSKSLRVYWRLAREYPNFPKLPEAFNQMGTTYLVAGHLDTARFIWEQLVQRFPNSPRVSGAHFRLADLAFIDNNYNKAYDHLKKVRKDQIGLTSWEITHYRLGECAYNTGDFDKAVEYFHSYVEACDADQYQKKEFREMALEYMAISFSDMPDGVDEAIKFFKKKPGKPYEAQVIFHIGEKNHAHGQWDAAIQALEGALKKYPDAQKEATLARKLLKECYAIKSGHQKANASTTNRYRDKDAVVIDYDGSHRSGIGRSRASIQHVIMQNMATLRDAYNRRLRDKPGLSGKITVKFAIDEFGKVIFAQVVESTMADSELERTVVDRVKSWNFDKIDKPGDVTEVTYPFVFSQ